MKKVEKYTGKDVIGNGTKERWELANVGAYGWKQKQLVMFQCLTIVCGELVSHVNLWNYLPQILPKLMNLSFDFHERGYISGFPLHQMYSGVSVSPL